MPENEFPKLRPHPFRHSPERTLPFPAREAPPYAELCVTSNYTFLTGASHPEEFIDQAVLLGYRAIAITDTHTLAGVVRAHVAAKDSAQKIQFMVGSRVRPSDMQGLSIFLYPTGMDSYRRLCRLLTTGKRRAPKGECHLTFQDLASLHEGLLAIAMVDDNAGSEFRRPSDLSLTREALSALKNSFGDDRLSLALRRPYGADDSRRIGDLCELAESLGIPTVATNDPHHHAQDRRMLQDVLTCIRHGCTIAEAGFRLHANAERHLKPPEEMHRLFAEYPQAVRRTVEIAERAAGFSLDQLRYEYPDEVVPAGKTPQQHLTDLTWEGARERFPEGVSDKLKMQIEYELNLIQELNYAPYFLTVHDLVDFARGRTGKAPILCQGRGGAANSAVCFCLGVTSVDPTKFQLLFERFISKERNEPPDIDIDFEHERREEVIQYIYKKYGRERAALTAEVISYRRRSAIRDVGKALGLSLDLVDRLAKSIEWWDKGGVDPDSLREMGLNPDDITLRWLARLVGELLGFPRHLSQHVGGFIITRTPLCELVPVENAAMPDRTVVEWDKDDIDAVGMLKVDVLGLGMLTCLSKCLNLVNRGVEVSRCRGVEGKQESQQNAGALESVEASVFQSVTIPKETHDGNHQLVSGSDRLAEEQEVGHNGVSRDGKDAAVGDVRTHFTNAESGSFNPVEYRRGIQPKDSPGVSPRPPDRIGLSSGTLNSMGDRNRPRLHQRPIGRDESDGGNRPDALCPHPEAGREEIDLARFPQPFPSRHLDTLTPYHLPPSAPRHLDTSTPLFLHTIPFEDPATYAMIQKADTIGVFQIESRAQMSMLPRLRPKEFYDLVIEVAIVRPGPIQGDMVHPYLRRRNKEEPIPKPPHPSFDEVLGRTLGVPLFQEQCMALAVKAAGFTPGEADQLRRAMAAWKRKGDQIYRFGAKLVDGMMKNGIPREFAERCFEQIKGFSEYGFPESHAASFALLVYASAWLKCHHPAEFAAAILNSQPMGFYAPAQLVRDAKEHGVEVRPIDVNHSHWDCTIEDGALRLGMRLVSGATKADADKVRAAIESRGPFHTLLSLWRASGAGAGTFRRLAGADAFASMNLSRQEALWHARLLRDDRLPLFENTEAKEEPAPLPLISAERQVSLDYNSTGLSLKAHPVGFMRAKLSALRAIPCGALRDEAKARDGTLVTVAGLVLVRQRPGTAEGVTFITLEDETGIANLIVWRQVYQRFRRQAAARLLIADGRVQRQGEVVHVIVTRLRSMKESEDIAVRSRDFR